MRNVVAAKQILVPEGLLQEVDAVGALFPVVNRRRQVHVATAWSRRSCFAAGRCQRPN